MEFMISNMTIRKTVFAGVIAALYAGLTIGQALVFSSYDGLRIAEILCILPFFFPSAVPGLFVGCIIANVFSPYSLLDMIAGSLASLLAATFTMHIGQMNRDSFLVKVFACFPPVAFNAIIIGAVIAWSTTDTAAAFWPAFATAGMWVGIGQFTVLYFMGLPLLMYLPKTKMLEQLQTLYKGEK
jgi:uncharacterized membrane protein